MAMKIGERIKKIRLLKGITQTQLAKMLGISAQSVQQWESAEVKSGPKRERIPSIARVLGVTESNLMGFSSAGVYELAELLPDASSINQDHDINVVRAPLVSNDRVGLELTGDEQLVHTPFPRDADPTTIYALDINYESGEYAKFDTLAVSTEEYLKAKCFVIRRVGEKRAFLAEIYHEGDLTWFESLNPKSQTSSIAPDQVEVVGWVLAVFLRELKLYI